MPPRPKHTSRFAAAAVAAIMAGATLLPFRKLLGPSIAGRDAAVQALAHEPRQPRRSSPLRGLCAVPRQSLPGLTVENLTRRDSEGCAYHFGHDGRVRLGPFRPQHLERPRDDKGKPLLGRARRRVIRPMKVQAQKARRRLGRAQQRETLAA